MKSKWMRISVWFLSLAALAVFIALYPSLPAQVPTHWGLDGAVEYHAKRNLWAFAVMPPVFAALFDLMPRIDPKKKNYEKFSRFYDGFCLFMTLFILICLLITLSESFHPGQISVPKVMSLLLAALFIFIGNLMPKVKSNFFMGIKNPWTLSNVDVWNKTHRLGGLLMFASGVLLLPLIFLLTSSALFAVMMALILLSVTIPSVCSYFWYKRLQSGDDPS